MNKYLITISTYIYKDFTSFYTPVLETECKAVSYNFAQAFAESLISTMPAVDGADIYTANVEELPGPL